MGKNVGKQRKQKKHKRHDPYGRPELQDAPDMVIDQGNASTLTLLQNPR